MRKNLTRSLFCLFLILYGLGMYLNAQDLHLVWADEFEGTSINPFQRETAFYYILQQPAQVSLKILSLTGQEVETVESGFRQKGEHVATRKLLLQIHRKP